MRGTQTGRDSGIKSKRLISQFVLDYHPILPAQLYPVRTFDGLEPKHSLFYFQIWKRLIRIVQRHLSASPLLLLLPLSSLATILCRLLRRVSSMAVLMALSGPALLILVAVLRLLLLLP